MSAGATLALGVWLLVAQAGARPAPRFELTWEAPACAAAPEVSDVVGEAFGRARVRITEEAGGYALEVVFLAPHAGRRALTVPTCAEAARAAALFLKLGATPEPDVPPPAVATAPSREPEATRLSLAGTIGGEAATFPSASPRLGASVSVLRAGVAAGVDVHTGLASRVAFGPNPAAAVDLRELAEAQVFACMELVRGRFEAGPCGAVSGGVWEIGGVNVVSPTSQLAPLVSVAAQVRAGFEPAPHVWLGAMAGVVLHVLRPSIGFDAYRATLDASVFGAQFQLAAGWRG